eukprot:jgi/Mesvir1/142/Mv03477-RA.1
MARSTIMLILAALICGAFFQAAADTYTYMYTGPALSGGSDHIEVTFIASSPLAPSTSYLATADAGILSGSVTVVGPNGAVDGLTLPISTFQIHTGSDASANVHGIDSWNIVGEVSALAGAAPALTGIQYQASSINTVSFIPGSDEMSLARNGAVRYWGAVQRRPRCHQ